MPVSQGGESPTARQVPSQGLSTAGRFTHHLAASGRSPPLLSCQIASARGRSACVTQVPWRGRGGGGHGEEILALLPCGGQIPQPLGWGHLPPPTGPILGYWLRLGLPRKPTRQPSAHEASRLAANMPGRQSGAPGAAPLPHPPTRTPGRAFLSSQHKGALVTRRGVQAGAHRVTAMCSASLRPPAVAARTRKGRSWSHAFS